MSTPTVNLKSPSTLTTWWDTRGWYADSRHPSLADSRAPAPPGEERRRFQQHLDHAIITSFPGLTDNSGARMLAELGDDRTSFTDARAVKAYAGSAPITRASGRTISITHRRAKNDRLAAAGWAWAFAALADDEHPHSQYRHRRNHGDRHPAALRQRFNRTLGQLYFCLQTGQHYHPEKAFTATRRPS
ncbi:transposase [Kribbella sp. NPDC055071]